MTRNDTRIIHTDGLEEGIRCAMCTNPMANNRGCDGGCDINESMYKRVLDVIKKNILEQEQESVLDKIFADNATNGDMIKTIFPNLEWRDERGDTKSYILEPEHILSPKFIAFNSWWDAPYKALEQEPCEDYISRQALLKLIGEEPFNWTDSDKELQAVEDYRNFRNIVEQLPSVNPQKQEPILDKIRAEILEEKECAYADFERYKVDYLGQDWEDALDSLPQDDFRYGMERAVEIIDKYKVESER